MDNAKIAEQYRIYKQKEATRKETEAAEKLAKEKEVAELMEKLKADKKPRGLHPVTTRKCHVCRKCKALILGQQRVMVDSIVTGFGYPEGYHYKTYYYCNKCCKVEEA